MISSGWLGGDAEDPTIFLDFLQHDIRYILPNRSILECSRINIGHLTRADFHEIYFLVVFYLKLRIFYDVRI